MFFLGGRKLLSRILGKIPYQPKSKAAFNRLPNHHTTQMPAKKNIHGSQLAEEKNISAPPQDLAIVSQTPMSDTCMNK